MAYKAPLKTFKVQQTTLEFVGYIDDTLDPTNTWVGFPYRYRIQLQVDTVLHGDPDTFMQYDATNMEVGQWISTSAGGFAIQITDIEEVIDPNNIIVIAEDVNIYNIINDPTSSGTGIGNDGPGIVYSIDENGLPLIGPIEAFLLPPTFQPDLMARFFYTGEFEFGGSEFLNDALSGDIRDGAIVTWTEEETKFTDAIDELNKFIIKISPERPLKFSQYNLTVQDGSPLINDYVDIAADFSFSATALTSGSFVDNSGKAVAAGTIVHPVRDLLTTATNPTPSLIIGDKGSIDYSINGVVNYSLPLDETDQTGTYGGLSILTNGTFNNVWSEVSFQTTAMLNANINVLSINNNYTGLTEIIVIDEDDSIIPSLTVADSEIIVDTNYVYTSGIPHFSDFVNISFTGNISNVALNTYPTTKIVELKSELLDNTSNEYSVRAGEHGTPNIFNKNHPPLDIAVTIDKGAITNIYGFSGAIVAQVNNAFNSFDVNLLDINYYGEFIGTGITEIVPETYIDNNPKRHPLENVARPSVTLPVDYATDFTSSDVDNDAAIVVGGVLKFSKENYSTYTPAGPDFSQRTSTEQFACFKFKTVTNNLSLEIDGTFKAAYVSLPGVDFFIPNATNGWFDLNKMADFPPGQWPGSDGYNDGCLIARFGTRYDISFGSISSAFSNDNVILLQFVLEEGQEIRNIYRITD